MTSVVIIGGGPGGSEAALTARQLGGEVTVIEQRAMGGSAVLTDVVPSKTLISVGQRMATFREAGVLGVRMRDGSDDIWPNLTVDLAAVNDRIRRLAEAQSADTTRALTEAGVRVIDGFGRISGHHMVAADTAAGTEEIPAEITLICTGGHPRVLPSAQPDGERILNWAQL
ncbi:MAG: FAD-dependent oxidoreductase, partial [Propionibacteriaceae bacterium]|nr:FAD-dependent oxidoreductase [Propionibacteriaceae bacterium]